LLSVDLIDATSLFITKRWHNSIQFFF